MEALLIKIPEVAARLGVSRAKVYELIAAHCRPSRRWMPQGPDLRPRSLRQRTGHHPLTPLDSVAGALVSCIQVLIRSLGMSGASARRYAK
jgi:predicted DNA-binding transcriptional regulator AlpA